MEKCSRGGFRKVTVSLCSDARRAAEPHRLAAMATRRCQAPPPRASSRLKEPPGPPCSSARHRSSAPSLPLFSRSRTLAVDGRRARRRRLRARGVDRTGPRAPPLPPLLPRRLTLAGRPCTGRIEIFFPVNDRSSAATSPPSPTSSDLAVSSYVLRVSLRSKWTSTTRNMLIYDPLFSSLNRHYSSFVTIL